MSTDIPQYIFNKHTDIGYLFTKTENVG